VASCPAVTVNHKSTVALEATQAPLVTLILQKKIKTKFRLISIIDIDINSIDNTFGVSISVSTILLGRSIESSIDDTFTAVFCGYFNIDTIELMLIKFQRISSLIVNYLKQNQLIY